MGPGCAPCSSVSGVSIYRLLRGRGQAAWERPDALLRIVEGSAGDKLIRARGDQLNNLIKSRPGFLIGQHLSEPSYKCTLATPLNFAIPLTIW
jgi:hypothetical protein